MTKVINIHKDSFMFMTGVMSCLWQCHVNLMHTLSNKVLPDSVFKAWLWSYGFWNHCGLLLATVSPLSLEIIALLASLQMEPLTLCYQTLDGLYGLQDNENLRFSTKVYLYCYSSNSIALVWSHGVCHYIFSVGWVIYIQ